MCFEAVTKLPHPSATPEDWNDAGGFCDTLLEAITNAPAAIATREGWGDATGGCGAHVASDGQDFRKGL